MLYMDLSVNGTQLFQCQPCFGQLLIRYDAYLGFDGAFMFVDMQGWSDPAWEDLGTRYQLLYFSESPIQYIPLKAVPVQNLAVVVNNQNCIIGLYDQFIDMAAVNTAFSYDLHPVTVTITSPI
jgi:hypothetical protein